MTDITDAVTHCVGVGANGSLPVHADESDVNHTSEQ